MNIRARWGEKLRLKKRRGDLWEMPKGGNETRNWGWEGEELAGL